MESIEQFKHYSIHIGSDLVTIVDDNSFTWSGLPHDELSFTPKDLIEFCEYVLAHRAYID